MSRLNAAETDPSRDHYSYRHYADPAVAEGFDALRFSGPIGELLLETQARLLAEAVAPVDRRSILDVGTGTGRAAIGLSRMGARVIGFDASIEMLRVARARTSAEKLGVSFGAADAHALPLADRSVDATVCLRVLMHAIDWRRALAELCRVSRWRVVVDFPALGSVAALESGVRHVRQALGRPTEAYRVMSESAVRRAFAHNGYRVVRVSRQFVLPIALHKRMNNLARTKKIEAALASVGLLRLFGSPVTVVAER